MEQYFTSSQFVAQRLRQVIGRPQVAQGLVGRNCLLPLNGVAAQMDPVAGSGYRVIQRMKAKCIAASRSATSRTSESGRSQCMRSVLRLGCGCCGLLGLGVQQQWNAGRARQL